MKNISLFPLLRNNYYYKKWLGSSDFELEQAYFNNKRRLLNVVMHGVGVVCGLTVTRVDGATVVIESGLAIDGLGREIVLSKPVIERLSDLEGFSDDNGLSPFVYLCAEYAETDRDPAQVIDESGVANVKYNHAEEGCRFYLTITPPEPARSAVDTLSGDNLEKRLAKSADERLYLAKISVVRWGEAYEIDYIEQVVQRITTAQTSGTTANNAANPTLAAPLTDDFPAAEVVQHLINGDLEPIASPTQEPPKKPMTASVAEPKLIGGRCALAVPPGLKRGKILFSPELPHGLGAENVVMSAAPVLDGSAVFGDSSVFDCAAGLDLAIKVNRSNGMFQIGVRFNADKPPTQIELIWIALKAEDAVNSTASYELSPNGLTPALTERVKSRIKKLKDKLIKRLPLIAAITAFVVAFALLGILFYNTIIAPEPVDNGITTVGTVVIEQNEEK